MINLNEILSVGFSIFILFMGTYFMSMLVGMFICMAKNKDCSTKNIFMLSPLYGLIFWVSLIVIIFILGVVGKLLLLFLGCI